MPHSNIFALLCSFDRSFADSTLFLWGLFFLQRTAKRLRLSKVKVAKYYDSGSLVVFYLVSLVWGINYIIKVSYLSRQCHVHTCTCTASIVCSLNA